MIRSRPFAQRVSIAIPLTRFVCAAVLVTAVLFYGVPRECHAAAGDLDPGFGVGGRVTTDIRGRYDLGSDVVIQADGKIVVVGTSYLFGLSDSDVAVTRYNPHGTLDIGFGTGGIITTDFANNDDWGSAVALQPDGKIVVAGMAFVRHDGQKIRNFGLVRYNPDGTLDTSFGSDGKVTTNFSDRYSVATDVTIQADGKIIAAGVAFKLLSVAGFALARYNTDGSIDASFGTDGRVITDTLIRSQIYAIALQSDGKIVAAGSTQFSAGPVDDGDFALARYNPDGTLDASFDGDGITTTDFSRRSNYAYAVTIQADGKIIAAGSNGLERSQGSSFALARYDTDGSLDAGFGIDGRVITDPPRPFIEYEIVRDVAVQTDGQIVAAGSTTIGPSFALARYSADGTLDTGFGVGGRVFTTFRGGRESSAGQAVAIQSNGMIVVAGHVGSGTSNTRDDFALARYIGASD